MGVHEHDLSDEQLQELFTAFDDVHATDELKASTLAAIFDQMDDEDKTVERPQLTLVEGGAGAQKAARAARRRGGRWLRVAAALLALTLVTGGVAYAVPVSTIAVTEGDDTVEMGVNVFGMAVSAQAQSEEVEELLEGLALRGSGYEDAMGRVVDALVARGTGDGSVKVQVAGGIGSQGERLDGAAERIIEERGLSRGEGGRAQDGTPAQAPTQSEASAPATSDEGGIQEPQAVPSPSAGPAAPDADSTKEPPTSGPTAGGDLQEQSDQGAAPDAGAEAVRDMQMDAPYAGDSEQGMQYGSSPGEGSGQGEQPRP